MDIQPQYQNNMVKYLKSFNHNHYGMVYLQVQG